MRAPSARRGARRSRRPPACAGLWAGSHQRWGSRSGSGRPGSSWIAAVASRRNGGAALCAPRLVKRSTAGLSSPASVADILGLGFWHSRVIDRNSSAIRRLLSHFARVAKPQQLQPLAQQIRVAGRRNPSARRPRGTPSMRRQLFILSAPPPTRARCFTSSRGAGQSRNRGRRRRCLSRTRRA